jgi:condensin complex subunit 2
LEDNSALTTDALEMDFAADPLFQKTAADFDEGGAKGLLLSHLDISDEGKILFDAGDSSQPPVLADQVKEAPASIDVDMEGFKCNSMFLTQLNSLLKLPFFLICKFVPPFDLFSSIAMWFKILRFKVETEKITITTNRTMSSLIMN